MTARGLGMKRQVFMIVALFSLCSVGNGEEPQRIPLDQIWAYKMPGTREIEESVKLADMRLVGSVIGSWVSRADRSGFKDLARPGFAVSGSGVSALRAAHAVFVEGKKPRKKFSPDDEITIVFFSEPFGGNHVRIKQVEHKDKHIDIQYQLEPYFERTLSETFALIPLGKMPAGEYHVEMHQLPREQKFIDLGLKPLDEDWSRKVLCKPFSFVMTEKRE